MVIILIDLFEFKQVQKGNELKSVFVERVAKKTKGIVVRVKLIQT